MRRVDDPIQAVLDRLFAVPQVKETLQQVQGILDRVGAAIEPRGPMTAPTAGPARRRTPEEVARMVMGFGPDEPLDHQAISRRRRELARKYHPDHGGSTEAMQRLNRAVEILNQTLRPRR